MSISKIHSSLLKKYIMYNICFVIIPIFIIVILYFNYTKNQIIKQFENIQEYALSQVASNVDSHIEDLSLLATQISMDQLITPYKLQSSNYTTMEALDRLNTYHLRTGIFDELYIIIAGDDHLYSGSGISSFNTFSNLKYRLIGRWNIDEFKNNITCGIPYMTAPAGCAIEENHTGEKFLPISYPVTSRKRAIGAVCGLISTSYFQNLLNGINSQLKGAAYIVNETGSTIFCSENNISISTEMQSLLTDTTEKSSIKNIIYSGQWYSAVIISSDVNDWKYLNVFPHSQFIGNLFDMQTPILAAFLIILIICIFMGILLALRYYQPLYILNSMLNKNTKNNKNELNEITSSIRSILENNKALTYRLSINNTIIKDNLLQTIVSGDADWKDESFLGKISEQGIRLYGPHFCIMAFALPEKISQERSDEFYDAIHIVSQDMYIFKIVYKSLTVILLNLKNPNQDIPQIADFIKNASETLLMYTPKIGVGRCYTEPSMLNKSMLEAITAAEASIPCVDGISTVYFDKLKSENKTSILEFSPPELLLLLQGIRQYNKQSIESSIQELYNFMLPMKLRKDSIGLRFVATCIMMQVVHLAEEMNSDINGNDTNSFVYFTDLDDFFGLLRNFCDKIICTSKQKKSEQKNQMFSQLLEYIQSSYTETNISLASISERFNTSNSQMSKLFHEKTGINFIDYITALRIERACNLLIETNLHVKDITEQVGYLDLSSFTRKFKQIMGTSPGKYRCTNRRQSPNLSHI